MSAKAERMETVTDTPDNEGKVSDTRLIEEIRQGRHAAFGTLVQRYERRLIRVISRFVSDLDLAEDLAQETFLRVYERLDQFDPARRFSPWLFRIGVNLAMDYHRRKKKRVWSFLFSDSRNVQSLEPVAVDKKSQHDLQLEVRRVVDLLPEKYRTVLLLRDMELFPTSEIAAILNRKEATIRWRLAEARLRFQELWEKHQE
jgi:RNA polymerase sigma-70 factor (ECF subfamily)